MGIHLAIPTLSRFDCLERCLDSALSGSVVPESITIIDNSGGKLRDSDFMARYNLPNVLILTPNRNIGVGPAWNLLLTRIFAQNPDNVALISNDDVTFKQDTIEWFAKITQDHTLGLVYTDAKKYALFAVRYWAFKAIGLFDEQFFPAYFEDNDYDYRARLLEVPICVLQTDFEHIGSGTLKSWDEKRTSQHHEEFRANQARYVRKWGGRPGNEQYRVPYNTY